MDESLLTTSCTTSINGQISLLEMNSQVVPELSTEMAFDYGVSSGFGTHHENPLAIAYGSISSFNTISGEDAMIEANVKACENGQVYKAEWTSS